jgi:hypothetical protein
MNPRKENNEIFKLWGLIYSTIHYVDGRLCRMYLESRPRAGWDVRTEDGLPTGLTKIHDVQHVLVSTLQNMTGRGLGVRGYSYGYSQTNNANHGWYGIL